MKSSPLLVPAFLLVSGFALATAMTLLQGCSASGGGRLDLASTASAPRSATAAESPAPVAVLAPAMPGPPADSYFGLNGSKLFHIPEHPEIYGQRLDWMEELGVRWDRIDLWWHVVEPEPGRFDFSRSDHVFDVFESRGVQWYPILCYGAADWGGRTGPRTEEEFQRFAEYAHRTVARYRDRAKIWSLWNEPNIHEFWSPQPNPEHYARLLELSHAAIKRADPEARIAAPVLAPLGAWDRKFTERLFQLGAMDHFDIFDYHYYRNTPPEQAVAAELAEIRAVMRRHGDEKPIWISEAGVFAAIDRQPHSYERQAALVVRNHLLCFALGVEKFFYFDLQNWHDEPSSEWDACLGLVEAGGEKKTAFHTYKTLVDQVDGKTFVGRVHPHGDAVEAVLLHDDREGHYILAAWLPALFPDPTNYDFHCLPREVRLVRPMGDVETRPFASADTDASAPPNVQSVPLDANPRYIHHVDPKVYLAPAGVRFEAALTFLAAGESARLRLVAHPLLESPVLRVVDLDLPEGIHWDPATGTLECAEAVAPGGRSLRARVEVEFGPPDDRTVATLVREAAVEIVQTVTTVLRPFLDDDGEMRLLARVTNQSSRPLHETPVLVERRGDAERLVLERPALRIEPGATWNETLPADGLDWADSTAAAEWHFRYGPFEARPFRVAVGTFDAAAPVIDGDLDEWRALPSIRLDSPDQLVRNVGHWDPDKASARVWVRFTEDTLYFAADVRDNDPMHNPHPPLRMYQADCFEVFLGFRGPTQRTVINKEFEYQIGIAPTSDTGEPVVFWFHKDIPVEGARVEARRSPHGYTLEAAIPLEFLEVPTLPLRPSMVLAYDVTLNDLDADDWAPAGNLPGRGLVWNGGPMNWIDPSGYGLLVIRDRKEVAE